ncbi:MAG: MAE_28990/MAE_18760 family HEPN-like nuclease [Telluria sp.]
MNDLVWREAELAIMRKQLLQTVVNSPQEQTLLRANVALLYAHYEGFCKFCVGVYIEALKKRKLKRKDLKWKIAAHSMKKFFLDLKRVENQDEFFTKFMDELNDKLDEAADFENIGETSNLWPDLLLSWLNRLDLKSKNVEEQTHYLHELVESRNKIAHGQRLTISTRAAFDSYSKAATLAMHEVALGVADALEHKSYQRFGAVSTILNHATPG